MYRFFVDEGQIGQGEIAITGKDVNHIRNVLRMKPGEKVMVSDGNKKDYCCEIKEISQERVIAAILGQAEEGGELPVRIYLFQGLPKSDKMEWIIQKAVELGVYQVIPVMTRRTVVKLDKKKEAAKVGRWNAISESAAKQSGRSVIPQIGPVMPLKEALTLGQGFQVKVIPFEHARGMDRMKREMERIRPGMDVGVFIGPEGGFEDEEIAQAESMGVKPISLGRRILRTETAGVMVLSVMGYLLESGNERI